MKNGTQVLQAALTWTGDRFRPGVQVAVDSEGRITELGSLNQRPTRHFPHHALLPGMINAHSHAFQRGLRGRGERFPEGAGTFWTWRHAMYRLVEALDAAAFYQLCRQAFTEMLEAGITAVGEFHYLHHNKTARDYAFDQLVVEAGAAAGIRLVLLNAYYRTGGIEQPLAPAQTRFETPSLDSYWDQMDRLAPALDPTTQSLGVVAHSIRAVGLEDITALHDESTARGLPFHMHVEEQRREVDECVAAYGHPPMALINDSIDLGDNFTAVHCTHTSPPEMERFLRAGGRVCLCPLTEANLGDGIPDLAAMQSPAGRVSLGTDSNTRIDMVEEMRWLEYVQRLRGETRGAVTDTEGHNARPLFAMATVNGAQALGISAGSIVPGAWADFAVLDLMNPTLAGWNESTLLDALVFGTGGEAISHVCVAGRWRESTRA